MTTRLEKKKKGLFRSGTKENPDTDILGSERVAQPTVYREHSKVSVFFILMAGIAAGAVAFWLLAVPAIRQGIYQERTSRLSSTVNLWQARERNSRKHRERPKNPEIR